MLVYTCMQKFQFLVQSAMYVSVIFRAVSDCNLIKVGMPIVATIGVDQVPNSMLVPS